MSEYIPFTYLIKFTHPDTKLNSYYYGVRYARNCHPTQLFDSYFTNSKIIKNLIKQFGTSHFEFQIRHTFPNDSHAAHRWEQTVLRRLNVAKRPEFFNMSVGGKVICMTGPNNPSSRQEVKDKISTTLKKHYETHKNPFDGKSHTVESKMKMSKALKGKIRSEEFKENLRQKLTGRKRSVDFSEKLSKRMKENNPSKGKPEVSSHLNADRRKCPHCGSITNVGNLIRWHLDKCKQFNCS